AIQGPQSAGLPLSLAQRGGLRLPPGGGPWIAHMGILASMVDFSFSCCGLFWRRGRSLDGQRAPSSSWKAVFPAAWGCQGAKLAGGDAHGAPLTAPSRRKSYEHEIEGAAG